MRQVEDLFDTMAISTQLNRFTSLTTLLNTSEATVIQDLTLMEPRPINVFDEAKGLLFARFDRPINERITGLQEDELPPQWLARFTKSEVNVQLTTWIAGL